MDLYKAIQDLHREKTRLDRLIGTLEGRLDSGSGTSARRRGRRGMSAEERRQVSERMKAYWAKRKQDSATEPTS